MESLAQNPIILIGLVVALLLLLLLGRGRSPRRIGLSTQRDGGAVSRTGRGPSRTPPPKTHTRHDKNWRTDTPRKTQQAKSAGSLHERLTQLQEMAKKSGRKPTQAEAMSVMVGSPDAKRALPKMFRVVSIAIWIWTAMWGLSLVGVLGQLADEGFEEGAIIGLLFVMIPIGIGLAALRAVRRFRKRLERKIAEGTG